MASTRHSFAVYNSLGQFQARFLTCKRAWSWIIREGLEWSAIIRKEERS